MSEKVAQVAGDGDSKPLEMEIDTSISLTDRLRINKNLLADWTRLLDDYDQGKLSKADPVQLKQQSSTLRKTIKKNVAELNYLYSIQHP